MIFETVESRGLAQLSYVVGDPDAGVCAVIDPRRDVEAYLELARRQQVRIEHVLETHVHADFVSGSRELAERTGATIHAGASDEYGFEPRLLDHGDTVEVGSLTLRALRTPGHSPEHVCYAIHGGGSSEPWGVFSGDTLFAGAVGRPDLAAGGSAEKLARDLHASIREVLLPLGDGVVVYPGHGAGSPCGSSIGERRVTTLGYERRHGDKLQAASEDEFVERVLDDLPEEPTYYSRMKRVNAAGPEVTGGPTDLRPFDPTDFREVVGESDGLILDTREIECFSGAHIEGALNVGLRASFPIWAGWLLEPGRPVFLVLQDQRDLETVQRHLFRVGLGAAGYLRQGMRGWLEAGLPWVDREDVSVQRLRELAIDGGGAVQILDVRSDSEWNEGFVTGAKHVYAPYVADRLDELDRTRPVVTYCGSGYRASIAASVLERHGFEKVHNVPGSMQAWKAAGYPLEQEKEERMKDRIRIDDEITVGAQPSRAKIETLPGEGFKAVMNLRTAGEDDQPLAPRDEGELVRHMGMDYEHFPVSVDDMDEERVDEFRRRLEEIAKPVYVHCGSGKRSGAFVMMHVASERGMSGEETLQQAKQMGFECDQEEINRFVAGYVDEHSMASAASGGGKVG